jgi:peroxiredoxin
MPTLNSPAPDFTLHQTKDKKVSLSELKGRKVVLAFVPGAFTGVCTKELCSFRDAAASLDQLDAAVVAVSVDGPFANMAWSSQNSFGFPVLSDHRREAVTAYDVAHNDFAGVAGYTAAKRSVFVIDGNGVLRWSWVAPNPGVEPDYAEINRVLAEI